MQLQRLKPFFAVVLAFLIVFSSLCLSSETVYAASPYPSLPADLTHRYLLYYDTGQGHQKYVLVELEVQETANKNHFYINEYGFLKNAHYGTYYYNRWEYKPGIDTDWRLVRDNKKGDFVSFSCDSPYPIFYESSYVIYSDEDKTGVYFDPNSVSGDFPYMIVLKQTFNQTGFQAFVNWIGTKIIGGIKKFFTGDGYGDPNTVYHTFYLTDIPRFVPSTPTTNLYFIVEKGQAKSFLSNPNARTYQTFNDADKDGAFRFLAGGEADVNSKVEIVAANFNIKDSAGNVVFHGDSSLNIDSLSNQLGVRLADDNAPTFDEFDPNESLEDGFLSTALNFVNMITNSVKSIAQMFTTVGTAISSLVNGYVPFLTQIFGFLPSPIPELLRDLFFLSVGFAIFRLIRG